MFGLVNRFIGSSLVVTTNNCNTLKITVIITQTLSLHFSYKHSALVSQLPFALMVTQLKRRNYSGLTESHTPKITHDWSLLITHQAFTGLLLILLQLRASRGCLLPRTDWLLAQTVFEITPSHGPHGKHALYCCIALTAQKTQLTWFLRSEFTGALAVA
jgi:hypothetical protein